MIEQFFLAKNRLAAAPEQGVWKTKRTAASRGCQRRQARGHFTHQGVGSRFWSTEPS